MKYIKRIKEIFNTKVEAPIEIFEKLYDYQLEAVKSTEKEDKGIVCMPTGVGKCLARGTEVLMYDGCVKKVEDVVVGDLLMGDDSTPREVLSLARGKEIMYDIVSIKGNKYTVNESHILSLKITNISNNPKKDVVTILGKKHKSGDIIDISVRDYLTLSKTAKHVLKGFRVSVDFNQNNNLQIEPRLLGLWLADGTSSAPSFTVNNQDVETIEYLKEQAKKLELNYVETENSINSKLIYLGSKICGKGNVGSNKFLTFLQEHNLINNKHIPKEYKTGTREQRIELLAGIIDGDGYYGNCFELTLVNEKLFDDALFVVRSLGFAGYKNERVGRIKETNFEGNYFRMNISGDLDLIPTIVKRKQASPRGQIKNILNYGITVIKKDVDDYYGFSIDKNRRFLLADFTVTHNTYCQAAMLAYDIIKNPNTFDMYIINAPRIMLSYQLLNEVYNFLTLAGIEARFMMVHSGGVDDEKDRETIRRMANTSGNKVPYSSINSATSKGEIIDMMNTAQAQNLPLIFVSTYHSATNIENARIDFNEVQPIKMILNDEAHYLVQERFHDILNTIISKRCYFFTATMVHTPSDEGRGMNNVELYGNVLYEMNPREAIDRGKMVRPRLHIIRTKGVYNTADYNTSISKIIKDSYEQHEAILTKLKPKLLVSTKGTADMVTFIRSRQYQTLRNNYVHIYCVSSNDEIGNNINGEQVKRSEFLRRLKEDGSDPSKKLLVLHYDILAEGIDVSGFTGIMPLRSMQKSKFMQTYGRSARLDKEDRKRLESGELTVHDLNKMNKPYAYVIIPNIVHSNMDDKEFYVKIIEELRTYGFKPFENIISSTMINGLPEIEELEGLNEITRRLPNYGQLVENLEADVEAEKDASLEQVDWVRKHLGL